MSANKTIFSRKKCRNLKSRNLVVTTLAQSDMWIFFTFNIYFIILQYRKKCTPVSLSAMPLEYYRRGHDQRCNKYSIFLVKVTPVKTTQVKVKVLTPKSYLSKK